jgi:putative flavoprotein involved in K+ transport
MPRRYRGMDIFWWLDSIGHFDLTVDDVSDALRASRAPSLQLVGGDPATQLDLATVQAEGVRVVGRFDGVRGRRAHFGDGLRRAITDADIKLNRTLDRIDQFIDEHGLSSEVDDATRLDPVPVPEIATEVDLAAAGIRSVVWATGFARSYPWLQAPVIGPHGEIEQRRGVTAVPGLYVLGQRFQHFRNSNFIDGVGRDARYVAQHIISARTRPEEVAA